MLLSSGRANSSTRSKQDIIRDNIEICPGKVWFGRAHRKAFPSLYALKFPFNVYLIVMSLTVVKSTVWDIDSSVIMSFVKVK